MIFRTFAGELMLALHSPNKTPEERPKFLRIIEKEGKIELANNR